MASAALSPGTPSSFLVRALTSWGGGEKLLARAKGCLVHALGGGGEGAFRDPKKAFGFGGGA